MSESNNDFFRLNSIDDLRKLAEIPIENVMKGAMVYGANSPYGALMTEADEFVKANLTPVILYYKAGDEALVTSEEYMNRKFH